MVGLKLMRQGRGRALYEEIKRQIADGTYGAGALLASTRSCAAERGLSRTTVSAVYEQLAAEGYIETRRGSASRVAQGAAAPRGASVRRVRDRVAKGREPRIRLSDLGERMSRLVLPTTEAPAAGVIDFIYGPLAGRDFPTLAWAKAMRRVEHERPATACLR